MGHIENKLVGGTHRQQGNLISLLSFFPNKEIMPKISPDSSVGKVTGWTARV
jgi:hypothetical protein